MESAVASPDRNARWGGDDDSADGAGNAIRRGEFDRSRQIAVAQSIEIDADGRNAGPVRAGRELDAAGFQHGRRIGVNDLVGVPGGGDTAAIQQYRRSAE